MTLNSSTDNTFSLVGEMAYIRIFFYPCVVFNPFPHIDTFLKTWRQKKKLLRTSNFSFCHHVFNSIQLFFLSFKGSFQFISAMSSKSLYVGYGKGLTVSKCSLKLSNLTFFHNFCNTL